MQMHSGHICGHTRLLSNVSVRLTALLDLDAESDLLTASRLNLKRIYICANLFKR